MTKLAETSLQHPQCWKLDINNRILFDDAIQIHLTNIEGIIVKNMLLKEERVISRAELISSIGRDPELYRGLEMSLSRLQIKFKKNAGGRHLFRAVRNRGYCLTQVIHINGEPSRKFTWGKRQYTPRMVIWLMMTNELMNLGVAVGAAFKMSEFTFYDWPCALILV